MSKRIECCSRLVLEYEIKGLIRNIKDDELLDFEIIPNPIQKGTFDLKIKTFKEIKDFTIKQKEVKKDE